MAKDRNRRAAEGKPPSVYSDVEFLLEDQKKILAFCDQLCQALVVGDENVRRVKVLSTIAAWIASRG